MFPALSGASVDLTKIKADLVLNAFRDQLNNGIAIQGLVDGFADEFEDASGVDAAASANETYDATGDKFHNPGTPVQISTSGKTLLGDMTQNGGLVAAFDGTDVQAVAASARKGGGSADAFIGVDWGAGNTKTVTRFDVIGSSDEGFYSDNDTATITATLQGSTDNFAVSIVDLGVTSGDIDAPGLTITKDAGLTASDYRYHRIKITSSDTLGGKICAECKFYEGGSVLNMTLVSEAQAALSAPDTALGVIWQEDVDAITLDIDLTFEASRDNGVTWTAGALSEVSLLSSGRLLTAEVNLSGQPSGTSVRYRLKTLNTKEQRIHGVGMDWG